MMKKKLKFSENRLIMARSVIVKLDFSFNLFTYLLIYENNIILNRKNNMHKYYQILGPRPVLVSYPLFRFPGAPPAKNNIILFPHDQKPYNSICVLYKLKKIVFINL